MTRLVRVLLFGILGISGSVSSVAAPPTEQELAARIDEHLATAWSAANVTPAPSASDAEFLRRAWLDLTGILPPLNESVDHDGDGKLDGFYGVRGFLADARPDKRQRLIQHLLTKPTHARHLATIWKNVMLPADANVVQFGGDNGFQSWLFGQFKDNAPYDRMVRDLLTASGQANQRGPALFYTALQLKPEELAASTSKIFLGVQIQCAQCHNHPFDHWKRDDFWSFAAFFGRLQQPQNQQVAFQVTELPTGELKIPETNDVAVPRFLGGQLSEDTAGSRRQRLAQWMTAADNPYFARATVNRVWALLFGRGIVDPVDDLGLHNKPSHPELLDELARDFAATGFDLKRLFRTLALTRAYQLSSESLAETDDRPELFARMAIKSLTAEQLYDCLGEAMRRVETPNNVFASPQVDFRVGDQTRQLFLNKFRAPTQGATDFQSGIPQALTLMNGAMIRQATNLQQSDILIALEAPIFTDEARIEILFLSTLSRPPTDAEREKSVNYVTSGGTEGDRRRALSDVLWALLNSAEFVLNH